jgi:c-di-GMP-binding flagellar brake protein YcgR
MKPNFGTVNFERRQHPRFSVNLPVEYRKVDNPKGRPANTGDLSEGGLLLYVSEPVEIGQEMTLKLFFTSERKLTTIRARAQVVWKDIRIENNGQSRIGLKFVDISPEDLKSLKEFINNLLALKTVHEVSTSNRSLPNYQEEGIIEGNS